MAILVESILREFGRSKFFPRKNNALMDSLLRAAADGGDGSYEDVLALLALAHGDGTVLSIVRKSDRRVIATSEGMITGALEAFVCTITYIDKSCYFARRERTNVAFRQGVECVRVRPLAYGDWRECSAILELRGMRRLEGRCYFDLLSALTALHVLRENAFRELTAAGTHPGRDECLAKLGGAEGGSVAVYGLGDGAPLPADYASRLKKVLSAGGNIPYRIGKGLFAIVVKGREMDAAEAVSSWLDACFEEGLVQTRVGCAEIHGDARLALYLSEKGCMESGQGEIRFVGIEDAPGTGRTWKMDADAGYDSVRVKVDQGETKEGFGLAYEGPEEVAETHEGMEE